MADQKLTIMSAIALGGAVMSAFLFLDDRHVHSPDLVLAEEGLNRRLLMAESTRYAEVEKYYTDRLRAGEPLTDAELARLDLVQRQQKRIAEILRSVP